MSAEKADPVVSGGYVGTDPGHSSRPSAGKVGQLNQIFSSHPADGLSTCNREASW